MIHITKSKEELSVLFHNVPVNKGEIQDTEKAVGVKNRDLEMEAFRRSGLQ